MERFLAEPDFLTNVQRPLPMTPKEQTPFSQELCDRQKRHKGRLRQRNDFARTERESTRIDQSNDPLSIAPAVKVCYLFPVIAPEQLVGEEWAEWYRLTPVQRWLESEKLWQTYLALGGSLDPEPDTQSPFFNARAPRSRPAHGRTGVRILRRSRV